MKIFDGKLSSLCKAILVGCLGCISPRRPAADQSAELTKKKKGPTCQSQDETNNIKVIFQSPLTEDIIIT